MCACEYVYGGYVSECVHASTCTVVMLVSVCMRVRVRWLCQCMCACEYVYGGYVSACVHASTCTVVMKLYITYFSISYV